LPGALGHAQSAQEDSFSDGLLDCPHYTRPAEIDGMTVPSVLQSGDHARIAQWRHQQKLIRTQAKRPDLYARYQADLTTRDNSDSTSDSQI
jgi:tRNA (guanine37-N1)-methyltransferase